MNNGADSEPWCPLEPRARERAGQEAGLHRPGHGGGSGSGDHG